MRFGLRTRVLIELQMWDITDKLSINRNIWPKKPTNNNLLHDQSGYLVTNKPRSRDRRPKMVFFQNRKQLLKRTTQVPIKAFKKMLGLEIVLLALITLAFVLACWEDNSSLINLNQEFDLGRLDWGAARQHLFVIQNTTSTPFTVTSTRTSCSCHSADLVAGTVVSKGEKLKVLFSLSESREGKQTGRMVISTDSPEVAAKQICLTLHAELPRRIWTKPDALVFTADNRLSSQKVMVMSDLPGILDTFQEVNSSRQLVTAKLVEKTPNFLLIDFALSPDALGSKSAFDYVALRFKDTRKEIHMLPIRLQSRDSLMSRFE